MRVLPNRYYDVATRTLRASPPDLSQISAVCIQRVARGRLARIQAMKIREIELRKTCVVTIGGGVGVHMSALCEYVCATLCGNALPEKHA